MELNNYNIGPRLTQEIVACKLIYWQRRLNCNENELLEALNKSKQIHGNAIAENVMRYL